MCKVAGNLPSMYTISDIAETAGRSRQAIRLRVLALGIKPSVVGGRLWTFSPSQRERILKADRRGRPKKAGR